MSDTRILVVVMFVIVMARTSRVSWCEEAAGDDNNGMSCMPCTRAETCDTR
jgi:hypothetical protein